ncbi:hypothetical protein [Brevibacillus laterosporus]|uniref:hypothetical protein n=1 Tax=Brevibacillus laterosporus TaxID=1465 RepID=UPI003D256738
MIVKVTNQQGEIAFVDNHGQVNGGVLIQGDSTLASHIDSILNQTLTLQFSGYIPSIDEKFIIREDGQPAQLYKASDYYIKNYFIPVECPLFNYTTEVVKE